MKKILTQLFFTVFAVALGVFLCFFYELGADSREQVRGIGGLLILVGTVFYLYLWTYGNDELRQSPSGLVYIVAVIFFGTPQLLLGIAAVLLILAFSIPWGIFTLHKTLPSAWSHIESAFRWPGLNKRSTELDNDSATLAENITSSGLSQDNDQYDYENSHHEDHVSIDIHKPFDTVQKPMPQQDLSKEIHDYARYIESLSKK